MGLKYYGMIRAWGHNLHGQCDVPLPNTGFVAVAGGGGHSLGLKDDGSIVAWGRNNEGQCDVPQPNSDFTAISAGDFHSLGLRNDGSIVAWGTNSSGQCNLPDPNTGFIAVSAGGAHSLGLRADGSIVAWGRNNEGQCDVPEPNNGFVAVSGGYRHSLGLKADGSIVAHGETTHMGNAMYLHLMSFLLAISAGSYHSLGLKSIGTGIEPPVNTDVLAITSVHPNPTIGSATVQFNSPGLTRVSISVFDTAGRLVRAQNLGDSPAGQHIITWDGRDSHGAELGSGVYFIRLQAAYQQASAKVVLVR